MDTITTEDAHAIPFLKKLPVVIEKGQGVYVWDQSGRKYVDFTGGWGVTSIGHANPVLAEAIATQSRTILQTPSSGLVYSPVRAALLAKMADILPRNLARVFFANSGAEANDAVIKLARKISKRLDVISMTQSFHGRTISTASATGQLKHREKYNPLMPNYRFVPFNDLDAMAETIDDNVAAVLLEPIQGEGGVVIPSEDYLKGVSELCRKHGVFLIVDEVQTGFCRTGPMFAVNRYDVPVDFMTMAKGIGGGFPFAAFAVSQAVADKVEIGDHGGTYCGNPLGCAAALAVITYLIENNIEAHVTEMGKAVMKRLDTFAKGRTDIITDVRGRGLLIAIEFKDGSAAEAVYRTCLANGLFVNLTQGRIVRLFPALNITRDEIAEGLNIFETTVDQVVGA